MKLHCSSHRSFWQRLSQVALLLLICAMAGASDAVTSFSVLAARATSLPEEEEEKGKEESLTAQLHSKRGCLRPAMHRRIAADQHFARAPRSASISIPRPVCDSPLTGPGIFLRC